MKNPILFIKYEFKQLFIDAQVLKFSPCIKKLLKNKSFGAFYMCRTETSARDIIRKFMQWAYNRLKVNIT